ncbi:MAG: hypothetical protein AB7Q27_25090 [Acidimicrobiia bacterium]
MKYLRLLSTSALWFSRADLLGDPLEGSLSQPTIDRRDADPRAAWQANVRPHLPGMVYVSCWHCSDHESAAMWSLYSADHGLAVVTNGGLLRHALDQSELRLVFGLVKYVNYRTQLVDDTAAIDPFMHKRHSFEHEREVRALALPIPTSEDYVRDDDGNPRFDLMLPEGLEIPIEPATLIEVRLSPTAPSWYRDVVEDATRRYGFNFQVLQSDLKTDALW